jgi:hypothetical protein
MRAAKYGLAVGLAAVVVLVPSIATAGAPGNVSIKHLGGGEFNGKVISTPPCRANRKVTLMRKKKGKDAKIVSDTTEPNGGWETGQTGETKGKFYAKLKKSGGCEGAKSQTIKIEP